MGPTDARQTDRDPPVDDQTATDDSDVDTQFRGLLEGLRTSLPGVQVLFGFLLVTPLQSEFSTLSDGERIALSVAFYSAGLAIIMLIAPSVHQRLRAPFTGLERRSKRHLIIATWVTIAGTAAMAVSIVSTIYLVSSILYTVPAAAVATTAVATVVFFAWVYLPLVEFRRR